MPRPMSLVMKLAHRARTSNECLRACRRGPHQSSCVPTRVRLVATGPPLPEPDTPSESVHQTVLTGRLVCSPSFLSFFFSRHWLRRPQPTATAALIVSRPPSTRLPLRTVASPHRALPCLCLTLLTPRFLRHPLSRPNDRPVSAPARRGDEWRRRGCSRCIWRPRYVRVVLLRETVAVAGWGGGGWGGGSGMAGGAAGRCSRTCGGDGMAVWSSGDRPVGFPVRPSCRPPFAATCCAPSRGFALVPGPYLSFFLPAVTAALASPSLLSSCPPSALALIPPSPSFLGPCPNRRQA